MNTITITKNQFTLSTDTKKIDKKAVHHFLSTQAYWCLNIPFETVEKAIENSLCFGIYIDKEQIGFARVITDYATIAYLGDVYILDTYRGNGLSKWLMETIMNTTELQHLRRWILLTRDAHELYRKYGWTNLEDDSKWMELHTKNVYSDK